VQCFEFQHNASRADAEFMCLFLYVQEMFQ